MFNPLDNVFAKTYIAAGGDFGKVSSGYQDILQCGLEGCLNNYLSKYALAEHLRLAHNIHDNRLGIQKHSSGDWGRCDAVIDCDCHAKFDAAFYTKEFSWRYTSRIPF